VSIGYSRKAGGESIWSALTASASSDSAAGPRRPSEAGMRAQGSATSRSRQILRARKSLISR